MRSYRCKMRKQLAMVRTVSKVNTGLSLVNQVKATKTNQTQPNFNVYRTVFQRKYKNFNLIFNFFNLPQNYRKWRLWELTSHNSIINIYLCYEFTLTASSEIKYRTVLDNYNQKNSYSTTHVVWHFMIHCWSHPFEYFLYFYGSE